MSGSLAETLGLHLSPDGHSLVVPLAATSPTSIITTTSIPLSQVVGIVPQHRNPTSQQPTAFPSAYRLVYAVQEARKDDKSGTNELVFPIPNFIDISPSYVSNDQVSGEVASKSSIKTLISEKKKQNSQWHLVINPLAGGEAGGKKANTFIDNVILPLLGLLGVGNAEVGEKEASEAEGKSRVRIREWRTENEGDGVRVGRKIRESIFHPKNDKNESSGEENHVKKQDGETVERPEVFLIILGGDGTTHEVLNGLVLGNGQDETGKEDPRVNINLVPIPTGTANAFHWASYPIDDKNGRQGNWYSELNPAFHPFLSFISSLRHFLDITFPPIAPFTASCSRPLQLALNTFHYPFPSSPDASLPSLSTTSTSPLLSHVVSSSTLHAAILFDSERLRTEDPTMERFKKAFWENRTTWWEGKVGLKGAARDGDISRGIWKYEPGWGWMDITPSNDIKADGLELEGPFVYVTSTLVDRLEPKFIVSPLRRYTRPSSAISATGAKDAPPEEPQEPPLEGTIDLVIIRPLRSPEIQSEKELDVEVRLKFLEKVLGPITTGMYQGGKHVEMKYEDEDGSKEENKSIVEYYRCGGWRWTPSPNSDTKSRLMCIDGTLREIPPGGWADVLVTNQKGEGESRILEKVRVWGGE